ncbi:MAG: DUF5378 family protein [Mycoplasmoidaceae bacterium]
MNVAGLTYVLIALAIVTTIVFVNHKIKFVTNSYWFWLAVGGFCFIWVLANRFIPDWINYWQNHDIAYADPGNINNSKIISRAFMLDACPCFFSLLCISLIADPSRRMARIFAPIALVGGTITLCGTIAMNQGDINAIFDARYLFFGIGTEKCYFIMHFMQLVLGVGVLLNTPKSGWRVWIVSLGSFAVYICYVEIMMAATGCAWFTTGLSQNDYTSLGEYHIVNDVTGADPKYCPLILLPFLMALGFVFGCVLKNFVFCRWIWSYGNVKSKDWKSYWNYNKFSKQTNKAWW